MRRNILLLVVALSVLAFLTRERDQEVLVPSEDTAPAHLQQVGFFTSPDRARLFIFRAPGMLSRDEAAAALAGVMHTPNQITVAVIYGPNADVPADGVTLAKTMGEAVALVSTPPFNDWSWRLWINPAGERILIGPDGE